MRALVAAVALVALSGCVSVAHEPALPFPDRPAVKFYRTPVGICTSEAEAQEMLTWLRKLNEFETARQRLLTGDP